MSSRLSPIGIDIRKASVHAVQLRGRNGSAAVHAAGSQPIGQAVSGRQDAPAPVLALQRLLASHPFRGRRVVSAVPGGSYDMRPISIPKDALPGTSGFLDALRMEARSCLLYPPDAASLDFVPWPQHGADMEKAPGLLVAAEKVVVNRHLALLKAAGLRSLYVDVGPAAAARSLADKDELYVIVDVDEESTAISLGRGSSLLFSRTINFGALAMIESLAKALETEPAAARQVLHAFGVSPVSARACDLGACAESGRVSAEALSGIAHDILAATVARLAREITRTIDYFAIQGHGGGVERIVLAAGALPESTAGCLDALLPQAVRPANPFARMTGAAPRDPGGYAVAAGLAMRGLAP